MSDDREYDRRGFLKMAALGGVATVLTGVPLAAYVAAPAMEKAVGRWFDFGSAKDIKSGRMSRLSYEFMIKDGWLVLPQRGFVWAVNRENTFTVFSSTCTHLACNVSWKEGENVFDCPCHSGKFNSEGYPIAGPPTKPLTRLEHKVENGVLMVFLTA